MEWNRTRMHISLKTQGQLFGKIISSAQDYKIINRQLMDFIKLLLHFLELFYGLKVVFKAFVWLQNTFIWDRYQKKLYILFITITFDHYVIFFYIFLSWRVFSETINWKKRRTISKHNEFMEGVVGLWWHLGVIMVSQKY